MSPEYIVSVSWGNDSIAMLQALADKGLAEQSTALYCDTGWAAPHWPERVAKGREWAESLGFTTHTTESEGFVNLARRKKAWPYNGAQFCTKELKVLPALAWMLEVDPNAESIVCIGVRRAESRHRATHPEWTYDSENHGGRDLWAPIVRLSDEERDELLRRAGFEPMPTRSMECYPCINANRGDMLELTEERIALIEQLEEEMGYTKNGKPRTFFRPHRHLGAVGIRAVMDWAHRRKGPDLSDGSGCDSGWCEV
jgi:3'-phosphoadenosine 5'-phosphosulfate sulfotransferase (PAPS reductase)/FAD synthetase